MVTPSFGFSIGDFVAVTGLIVTVVQSLRGISDDLIELQELQVELCHLKNLFEVIGRDILRGDTICTKKLEVFLVTFSNSQRTISDFKGFVDKYAGVSTGLGKYRKRLSWSIWKKQKVAPFRKRLQCYITALSIIQGSMNG